MKLETFLTSNKLSIVFEGTTWRLTDGYGAYARCNGQIMSNFQTLDELVTAMLGKVVTLRNSNAVIEVPEVLIY